MDNTTTYELLWQITQKEKQTNELQLLPKTFYNDINEFVGTFDGKELTEEDASTKKNTLRLLNELYERRKQKILIYVAYKKQMPQPAAQPEIDFYNNIAEVANRNKLHAESHSKGGTSLKSLQAIPEIILPSGKKVGPFEKGQIIELNGDGEDIKFLISNSICQPL